jgi:hypothetical protein
MGSDLHFAIPEAEKQRAYEVYKALREALKLKGKVERLVHENVDSAELGEFEEFFSALEEAEKAMTRPLF